MASEKLLFCSFMNSIGYKIDYYPLVLLRDIVSPFSDNKLIDK